MINLINTRLKNALKNKNEQEKSILRLVKGELERISPPKTDNESVSKVIKKIMKNNTKTLEKVQNRQEVLYKVAEAQLKYENEYLTDLLRGGEA